MNNVPIISKVLFIICRILGIIYLFIASYSAFSILTGWSYIEKEAGKYFAVCWPFTNKPFLNGENTWQYMLFNFLLPIGFYGLFFILISNVFKLFTLPKLFTSEGVTHLKRFYIINITVPWMLILLASIFCGKIEEGLDMVAVIHFFLGVFAYFLAAIFSKGVKLQSDQDLII